MTEPTAATLPLPERDALIALLNDIVSERPTKYYTVAELLKAAREAAAALAQRDGIPREPTETMIERADQFFIEYGFDRMSWEQYRRLWRAMYDAAPTGIPRSEDAERKRADALWQECENYRTALQELYKYQLPTRALNLIHQVLDGYGGIPRDDARATAKQ